MCKELENERTQQRVIYDTARIKIDMYDHCLDKAYKRLGQLEKQAEIQKMTPAEALRAALD
jgi:hypothetical protein